MPNCWSRCDTKNKSSALKRPLVWVDGDKRSPFVNRHVLKSIFDSFSPPDNEENMSSMRGSEYSTVYNEG